MFNTLKSKDGLTVITEEGTISESNTIEVTTAKERDKLRTSKSKPKKLKKENAFSRIFSLFKKSEMRKVAKSVQDTIPYMCVCNNYIIQLEPFKYSKT